jgi:hypothetical protein
MVKVIPHEEMHQRGNTVPKRSRLKPERKPVIAEALPSPNETAEFPNDGFRHETIRKRKLSSGTPS